MSGSAMATIVTSRTSRNCAPQSTRSVTVDRFIAGYNCAPRPVTGVNSISVVTELKIVGGDPALDLANTVGDDRVPDPLEDYAAFAAWAARIGVIDEPWPAGSPPGARPAAGGRRWPRRARCAPPIDAVFRALATGSPPPEPRSRTSSSGPATRSSAPASCGRELAWDGDELERPLWPLAVSALDLLRTARSTGSRRARTARGCSSTPVATAAAAGARWTTAAPA